MGRARHVGRGDVEGAASRLTKSGAHGSWSPTSLRPLLALGIAVLLGLLYYRPVKAYMDTQHTLQARSAEVQELSARKRQLEDRLAEIQSGRTLVRGARRVGLVKPGERLFIVRGIPAWRHANARR